MQPLVMTHIRFITMFIFAFSSVLACSGELEMQVKTADSTIRLIQKLGARETISRLFADGQAWEAVCKGIASGTQPWLSVADKLKPASDAASSEDLQDALIAALANNPVGVLRFVRGRTSDRDFSLGGVCAASPRSESKAVAFAHLAKAERAVTRVTTRDLKQMRNECLASLREYRKVVRSSPSE